MRYYRTQHTARILHALAGSEPVDTPNASADVNRVDGIPLKRGQLRRPCVTHNKAARLTAALILLQVTGCAMVQTQSGAPIEERGPLSGDVVAPAPLPEESEVTVTPLPGSDGLRRQPSEGARRVPQQESAPSNNAVIALLDNAGQQSRSGKLDSAAAALERALRIEPRNPEIWHRLAAIRLQQGQFDQAASLAAKSINLAGNNPDLIARNKTIIAQARQRQGR